MDLYGDEEAFFFSGLAFLLIIPALLVAASLIHTATAGTKITTTVVTSDKVYYAFEGVEWDFKRTVEYYVQDKSELTPSELKQVLQQYLETWGEADVQEYARETGTRISVGSIEPDVKKRVVTAYLTVTDLNGKIRYEGEIRAEW